MPRAERIDLAPAFQRRLSRIAEGLGRELELSARMIPSFIAGPLDGGLAPTCSAL